MTALPLLKLATLLLLLLATCTCNAEANSGGGYLVKNERNKRRIKSGKNSRAPSRNTNTRSNTVPRVALKGKGAIPSPVTVQTKAPSTIHTRIPDNGGAGGGGGTPTTSGNEPTGKEIFPCYFYPFCLL